jgi:hypothetical protein
LPAPPQSPSSQQPLGSWKVAASYFNSLVRSNRKQFVWLLL